VDSQVQNVQVEECTYSVSHRPQTLDGTGTYFILYLLFPSLDFPFGLMLSAFHSTQSLLALASWLVRAVIGAVLRRVQSMLWPRYPKRLFGRLLLVTTLRLHNSMEYSVCLSHRSQHAKRTLCMSTLWCIQRANYSNNEVGYLLAQRQQHHS
jgi:hypothetical protein